MGAMLLYLALRIEMLRGHWIGRGWRQKQQGKKDCYDHESQ